MKSEKQKLGQDWENAQAALASALAMPGGPARIEALKRAGRLRFNAASELVSSLAAARVIDKPAKRNRPA